MRTLIDLPDEDVASLDRLAQHHQRSRAAEVREAVRVYLRGRSGQNWIARGAGYWKHRTDIGDAVEYQRGLRADRDVD